MLKTGRFRVRLGKIRFSHCTRYILPFPPLSKVKSKREFGHHHQPFAALRSSKKRVTRAVIIDPNKTDRD
eukprot:scaffold45692_cov60-Phaeocystis_antarctica.AAC.1